MNLLFFSGNRAEVDIIFNIIENIVMTSNGVISICSGIYILMGGYHDAGSIDEFHQERADQLNIELFHINQTAINIDSTVQNVISQTIEEMSSWLVGLDKKCIVCIYADRAESFGASIAAFTHGLPIIHIEGGEVTKGGTFDDRFRHAISALSDFHLPVSVEAKKVLLGMGYAEKNIGVFPLCFRKPRLDSLKNWQIEILQKAKLCSKIVIATFHPLSNNLPQSSIEVSEFFKAIGEIQKMADVVILTYPNNDQGSHEILGKIFEFKDSFDALVVPSLGLDLYHMILGLSGSEDRIVLSVGNSSSGLKEVGYWGCTAINVGRRQDGRHKPEHVMDVPAVATTIISVVQKCLNEKYKARSSEVQQAERKLAQRSLKRAITQNNERLQRG